MGYMADFHTHVQHGMVKIHERGVAGLNPLYHYQKSGPRPVFSESPTLRSSYVARTGIQTDRNVQSVFPFSIFFGFTTGPSV